MITETDVLIVGTGFSGLGMAIRLKQAGLDSFIVLEQANAVGGTWRDNHYPGVACDVPSHLYSFSFEPNPKWSRMFAKQSEILTYMNHCADKYKVRPHIQLGIEVTKATFDDRRGVWDVETKGGRKYRARALVHGGGGLSKPSFPKLKGLETFKGKKFHTARWDHEYPLAGKRVAVIGTGASAIQAVPSIIDKVGHLTLFQRTPAWVLPKPDVRFDAKQQERFEKHPWVQRMIRGGIYAFLETGAFGFTGMVPGLLKRTEWRARKFMEQTIADPVLRSKLTPNYRIGCKRILLSNTYFPALQKPNASVVTAGITEIRENAIVTQDGQEHAVDAIVFATGFEAAEAQAPYELRGRDGRDLNKEWVKGGEGYFGVAVTGFPNFFMLVGPNSGLGNNSMVFMIESQINYVMDALAKMRDRSVQWVDVKPEVQRVYNEKLTQRLKKAIWTTGGCVSWYHTQAGRNTTLWPGFTLEFRLRTRNFDIENYEARPKADVRPDLAAVRSAPELTDNPAE